MKRIGRKILGLALGPVSLLAAELAVNGGERRKVLRLAEFLYPQGLSLEKPAELGQALAVVLREQGFTARDAALGLPARWLLTRRKELPPAAPEMALSTLRLQAEAEFSSEAQDLVTEFLGRTSATQASSVLLVATPRSYIGHGVALCKAAGLRPVLITPTATALAAADAREGGIARGGKLMVSVGPTGAELLVQHRGVPLQLRHLSLPEAPAEAVAPLGSEIRRALALLPAAGAGAAPELTLWDGRGITRAAGAALRLRMPAPLKLGSLETQVTLNGAATAPAAPGESARYAPALAVALAALDAALRTGEADPQRDVVDLLHSRLAAPLPPSRRRRILWGAATGAALLIAGGTAVQDLRQQREELTDLNQRLQDSSPAARAAEVAARRLSAARPWFDDEVRYLACLREITALFPDEGSIWASALSLRGGSAGQLSGKATGEQPVLALLDRIQGSAAFRDVKLLEIRGAGRTGQEVTFSISFNFRGFRGFQDLRGRE